MTETSKEKHPPDVELPPWPKKKDFIILLYNLVGLYGLDFQKTITVTLNPVAALSLMDTIDINNFGWNPLHGLGFWWVGVYWRIGKPCEGEGTSTERYKVENIPEEWETNNSSINTYYYTYDAIAI